MLRKRGAALGCRKISCKNALSQLDWVISLGVFMLFLAWFFVFAAPNLSFNKNSDSLAYIVESKLSSYYWNVYKIPLFVNVNRTTGFNQYEPFIGDFNLDPGYNYSFDGGKDYESLFGKIVFLANISQNRNVFYILKSNSDYDKTIGYYDLSSNYNKVEIKSENFIANLRDGYVDNLNFHSKKRLEQKSMVINGVTMKNALNYSSNKILSYYYLSTNSFNYSQVFFANNPTVYDFFDTFDSFDNLFSVDTDYVLDDYPYYYFDNSKFGSLDYSNNVCYNKTSKFLTFYDDAEGLFYEFSRPVFFKFCTKNNTIQLSTDFNLTKGISYSYGFYSGSYENSLSHMDHPTFKVGIGEVLLGINLDELNRFNHTVQEIKKEWGFPEQKDFRIVISDIGTRNPIFDFKTNEIDATADVYSKEYNDYILDKYGNLTKVIVTIMTW